jgi:hypothetical protein
VAVKVENGRAESFGDSVGLMGSYHEGTMLGRDRQTVLEDPNAFGQEWMLMPSETSYFQKMKLPQQMCAMPPPQSDKRRRLGESEITEALAAKACADVSPEDFDFCVYDILATSDMGMAGAY